VQFKNGSANLGPARPLNGSGVATLTIPVLVPGQTITAVYSGDTSFLTSSGTVSPAIAFGHTLSGGPCTGNLTISGGSWLVSGACIGGTLSVGAGTSVAIINSRINNQLTSTNPGTFALCGTTVAGNTNVTGASGFVLLGDPGDDGCAANTLKNLSLGSNAAGVEMGANAISGNVSLTNNAGGGPFPDDASPELEANRIGGNLSCSANNPAPTNDAQPNVVTGNRAGQCAAL
jgi:hypothetical protein